MRCQKCNAELLHDDIEKCPFCGNLIHNHKMYEYSKIIKCPHCKSTTTEEYKTCPYCGKTLKNNFNFSNIFQIENDNIKNRKKIIYICLGLIIFFNIFPIIISLIVFILSILFK